MLDSFLRPLWFILIVLIFKNCNLLSFLFLTKELFSAMPNFLFVTFYITAHIWVSRNQDPHPLLRETAPLKIGTKANRGRLRMQSPGRVTWVVPH